MLELSMAVCTEDQKVGWVMAHGWVQMVYLKIWFAVSFFKGEGTELTLAIMQFAKQNTDCRGRALMALGQAGKYSWAWSAG
jgi:hypothetical protein